MKITRERKAYGVILVLAASWLGMDQFSHSPTGITGDSAMASVAPITRAASSAVPAFDEPTLAEKLASIQPMESVDTRQIRDAFHPENSWLSAPAGRKLVSRAPRADEFVESHRLTAVVARQQGGSAIVDGKFVQVGKTFDGFTLVRVDKKSVLFQSNGVEVALQLSDSN